MSSAPAQFAPAYAGFPKGRTPLAHLLHALNQPLTGLQCSLELALAGPRSAEQHVRTLRESLELSSRMRILVEALRELADQQTCETKDAAAFPLNEVLVLVADDLRPVAQEKKVTLRIAAAVPQAVCSCRNRIERILFRLLESALSLCREGTDLQVSGDTRQGVASWVFSWTPGAVPEYSPFSRPELGLLLAQSEWEAAGGRWNGMRQDSRQTCRLELPLLPSPSDPGGHSR